MMLYLFDNLRKLLDKIAPSKKAIIEKNLIVEGEDFTRKDIEGQVIYRDNGIFVLINGIEFQRYIYKKKYSVSYKGDIKFPVFHFIKCSTVKEYGIQDFCSASKSTVLVIDKYTKKEYPNKVLRVCTNCISEASCKVPKNTNEFFEMLSNEIEEDTQNKETDIFGYTFNWQEVSEHFRKQNNYTCSSCKITITNELDRRFIHVHHKNGNKKWNNPQNLECLCVLYHRCVDSKHQENFDRPRMKYELDSFVSIYRTELKKLNNKCLEEYDQKK